MHKEGFVVNNEQVASISPGRYQFRPTAYLPWMNVRVYRHSIAKKEQLCVRFAGVELEADKFISKGEWKAI